jgi:hypothetical protein
MYHTKQDEGHLLFFCCKYATFLRPLAAHCEVYHEIYKENILYYYTTSTPAVSFSKANSQVVTKLPQNEPLDEADPEKNQ